MFFILHLLKQFKKLNMKKLFKKATVRKNRTVSNKENYFRAIPSQALKTWRHFDRFNVELYHDYLIKINQL